MMFAAWFEIYEDEVVIDHPTALRVYARLLRNPRIFMHPQSVKARALAKEMHVHRSSVQAALTLLIGRGYVIDHGRGGHNVRQVTLVAERTAQSTNGTH